MMQFRLATREDAEDLARIRIDLLREINKGDDFDEQMLYQNNYQYFQQALADGSFSAWIVLSEGQIVAISGVTYFNLPPNRSCPSGKTAYISNMFTYPAYRNQGIATRLFALTVGEARNHGCDKVMLTATDMGRPVYEKYGFQEARGAMTYSII